jgi:putative membrane-bound dehydrogenase-like protein
MRTAIAVCIGLAFGFSCWTPDSVSAAEGDGAYEVGVARVDVTPAYPIRLHGFGGRREESEGITQRIWAKALAIGADNQKPVVIVTLDSLGIRESLIDDVVARLQGKAAIAREQIVVAFSHSHTTPKLNDVADTIFSTPIPPEHQEHIDRYTREVTDAVEHVVLAALADRRPSTLWWAVGKVGFAKNRRTEGGPVDHDLPMLVVKDAADDSIRAVYTTYACHCVTLSDNKISGDWAGFAQEAIERNHRGATALVSIGCGSDSNPDSGVTGSNTAAAADQGAQIADDIERLLGGPLEQVTGALTATLSHIDLPLATLPTEEQLKAAAANDDPAGYNAKWQLEKLERGEPLQSKLDYPIQIASFGDSLAMVFLAGEVCVDYSLRLKEELNPEKVWVHGYANDFCAYIPSERLLKEGGYGGGGEIVYFALPTTLAPGMEEAIIGQVHKQIPPQFVGRGPRRAASVQPWPLDEALASLVVKPGFVVEVAAAEPLVADPVAIDFGPDGRLWVADMTDYGHDVDDEFEPTGAVRMLADRDSDGQYDESIVFQGGLRFPTDVKAWRDGVIVCDAPDVIYLEDRDGDGRADVRKVLLTGFSTDNAQARVNSLRWGLDNWLYGSCGILGGQVRTFTGHEVPISRDFRFRPDTGELEPVTGMTQQGRARDDWGSWFGCTSGQLLKHYPLVDRYLARNPHIAPPATEIDLCANANLLHPIGEPSIFVLSGPPGRPTGACGLDFYRDDLLGAEFANNAFVAEPVNQLVHREILSPQGGTFTASRAADEPDVEFLASTDPWFRPVQLRTGLDGCLYVVDMHRELIEHPKFIPADDLRKIDVMGGREQGRIFRIRPKHVPARRPLRLDRLNTAGLAAALDSPNGPLRDLAQQLLVQRRAASAVPQLRKLALTAARPATRLQALCTLEGLESLDAELLVAAMSDADAPVRRHAVRLSEPFLASSPQVRDAAIGLVDDPDLQVAIQLAYSLGEVADERAARALATLAISQSDDAYLMAAVWSSVGRHNVADVVATIFERAKGGHVPPHVSSTAVQMVLAFGNHEDVTEVASAIGNAAEFQAWQFDAAAELIAQSRRHIEQTGAVEDRLAPALAAARKAIEGSADDDSRLAALGVMIAANEAPDALLPHVAPLLGPQSSPAVQDAAINMLASIGSSSAGEALIAAWRGFGASARAHVFDVLLGDRELTTLLLNQLSSGEMTAADLDAFQRQRLVTHADEELRSRAAEAMATASVGSRRELVEQYLGQTEPPGEPGRGRAAFAKHCSSCHRLDGQGHEVGPDLAALTTRTRANLIQAIFDPNQIVDQRYRSYTAITVDGLAHSGLLVAETSTSVTLVDQQARQHVILRNDLESLETEGRSLMPEGFEQDLSPAVVNDLVAYLSTAGPPAKIVDGNRPQVVRPDADGTLWLMAANSEIYGGEITFEQPFQNIGYWHGESDSVAWTVELETAGHYDAFVHWACADDAAGNTFAVDGGAAPLAGVVGGTGGYDQFRVMLVGQLQLAAGENRVAIRPEGPKRGPHLMDLRGLYLVPVGGSHERASGGDSPDLQGDAASALARLLDNMAVGQPAEYERIPDIFHVALAAGRRNEALELARVLDLSLPAPGETLADWQAVAIGGGVVNGVSQSGAWPQQRVAEVLVQAPALRERWERVDDLAAMMANDNAIPMSTRYDALRLLGAFPWNDRGETLSRFLGANIDAELQMGAVSAVGDMDSPAATQSLVAALPQLEEGNRRLAIAALLRTVERRTLLAQCILNKTVARDRLTPGELAELQPTIDSLGKSLPTVH